MVTPLTVYAIDGITPVVDPTAYVHPSAVLIGDVIIGPGVLHRALCQPARRLRAHRSARRRQHPGYVRDARLSRARTPSSRRRATSATAAVLHGCIVQRNALVGMNAVINDNAVIGESAIVAAMAFVKAGFVVPPRTLVAGVPARLVRDLTEQEMAWKDEGTRTYQELTRRSLATITATQPLASPEPGRKRIEVSDLLPLSVLKAGAPVQSK